MGEVILLIFWLHARMHETHEQGVRTQHRRTVLWMKLRTYVPAFVRYLYYLHEIVLGIDAHARHALRFILVSIGIVKLIAVTVAP